MTKEKNLENFFLALGLRESSGRYDNDKNSKYHGMYQMGKAALIEAGYCDREGRYTGRNGVYSKKDFLNNPAAQEDAVKRYEKSQWRQIKSICGEYVKKEYINGIKLTDSGLIAGAHLVGPSNLCVYLKSNGKSIPVDGNGTKVEEYVKKFAGYDVQELTGEPETKRGNAISSSPRNIQNATSKNNSSPKVTEKTPEKLKGKDLLNQMREDNNAKLNKYEQIIYNWMSKSSEKDEPEKKAKLTGEMLKNQLAMQNSKKANFLQKIYMESDSIQKKFSGKVPKDYENPYLKNNKIFTKEEEAELKKKGDKTYDKAIRYQKKTIGIPDEKQAQKAASDKGSGLVYVSGYTRGDGTVVAAYYRAKPQK